MDLAGELAMPGQHPKDAIYGDRSILAAWQRKMKVAKGVSEERPQEEESLAKLV